MTIRRATVKDMDGIHRMLRQLYDIHYSGRPDLFVPSAMKYTDETLSAILADDRRPVFAAVNEDDQMIGYAFCIIDDHTGDPRYANLRTLYLDDLCVDETVRGQHIGTALYQHVREYARSIGAYNLTLNVWTCNPQAMGFYEHLGLKPYQVGMEEIL